MGKAANSETRSGAGTSAVKTLAWATALGRSHLVSAGAPLNSHPRRLQIATQPNTHTNKWQGSSCRFRSSTGFAKCLSETRDIRSLLKSPCFHAANCCYPASNSAANSVGGQRTTETRTSPASLVTERSRRNLHRPQPSHDKISFTQQVSQVLLIHGYGCPAASHRHFGEKPDACTARIVANSSVETSLAVRQ